MKVMFAEKCNIAENNIFLDLTEEQMRLLDFLKEKEFLWDDIEIVLLKEENFKRV